ncbi:MAG: hypothetical protein HQK53_06240 [Oligoflexia bacterium]|nr:hypothetical protein [Oligoflexia bacterium]
MNLSSNINSTNEAQNGNGYTYKDNKDNKDNEIYDSYYNTSLIKKYYWTIFLVLMLSLGVMLNFSFFSQLQYLMVTKIKALVPCPLQYKEIKNIIFFPGIAFKDITFSKSCLKTTDDITFKELRFTFEGFGIYPLIGIKISSKIDYDDKTKLVINSLISWKESIFKIDEGQIGTTGFLPLFEKIPRIKGNVQVKSFLRVENKRSLIKEIGLLLKSNDLLISEQNIQGMTIPELAFKNFSLKATQSNQKTVNIEALIGIEKSPMYITLRGPMTLAADDFTSSSLKLKTDLRITPELLKNLAIVTLLLKKYEVRDGEYRLSVGGTLKAPSLMQYDAP